MTGQGAVWRPSRLQRPAVWMMESSGPNARKAMGCTLLLVLLIDAASHRAFIACEGNDRLIVIDLGTGAALAQFPVTKDPDVLAFDAQRQKLYVAGESGEVSEFSVSGNSVSKSGESFLAHNAHVVAVQPSTHEIYFPLMNVNGKPVLRIMQAGTE